MDKSPTSDDLPPDTSMVGLLEGMFCDLDGWIYSRMCSTTENVKLDILHPSCRDSRVRDLQEASSACFETIRTNTAPVGLLEEMATSLRQAELHPRFTTMTSYLKTNKQSVDPYFESIVSHEQSAKSIPSSQTPSKTRNGHRNPVEAPCVSHQRKSALSHGTRIVSAFQLKETMKHLPIDCKQDLNCTAVLLEHLKADTMQLKLKNCLHAIDEQTLSELLHLMTSWTNQLLMDVGTTTNMTLVQIVDNMNRHWRQLHCAMLSTLVVLNCLSSTSEIVGDIVEDDMLSTAALCARRILHIQQSTSLVLSDRRPAMQTEEQERLQLMTRFVVDTLNALYEIICSHRLTDDMTNRVYSFVPAVLEVSLHWHDARNHALWSLFALSAYHPGLRGAILPEILNYTRLMTSGKVSTKQIGDFELGFGTSQTIGIHPLSACVVFVVQSHFFEKLARTRFKLSNSYKSNMILCHEHVKTIIALVIRSAFERKQTSDGESQLLLARFLKDIKRMIEIPEFTASQLVFGLIAVGMISLVCKRSNELSIRVNCLDTLSDVICTMLKLVNDSKLHDLNVCQIDSWKMAKRIVGKTAECLCVGESDEGTITTLKQTLSLASSLLTTNSYFAESSTSYQPAFLINAGQNMLLTEWLVNWDNLTKKNLKQVASIVGKLVDEIQSGTSCEENIEDFEEAVRSTCYDEVTMMHIHLLSHNHTLIDIFKNSIKMLTIIFLNGSNPIQVRSKSWRCLAATIEIDSRMLSWQDISSCLQQSLFDRSISIRETTIDLLSRYVGGSKQLAYEYYQILCERTHDVGISVRKRAIRALHDIIRRVPDFEHNPDICLSIVKRLSDERTVQNLATDTLLSILFREGDDEASVNLKIASLSLAFQRGIDKTLTMVFKKALEIDMDIMERAQAIVNQIIRNLPVAYIALILPTEDPSVTDLNDKQSSWISRFQVLHLFSEHIPECFLREIDFLSTYLNCRELPEPAQRDTVIMTARILQNVIPSISVANRSFLKTSTEPMLKRLALTSGSITVDAAISCMSVIAKEFGSKSHIAELYRKLCDLVVHTRNCTIEKGSEYDSLSQRSNLLRSIFILGAISKYMDPNQFNIDDGINEKQLLDLFCFFIKSDDRMISQRAMEATGFFLTRNVEFFIQPEMLNYYRESFQSSSPDMLSTVMSTIEGIICRQQASVVSQAVATSNFELEQNDETGVMSIIVQEFLDPILMIYKTCLHDFVRQKAALLIAKIVLLGIVHPSKCLPSLLAMSSEDDETISSLGRGQLNNLHQLYPSVIQFKALQGFHLAFSVCTEDARDDCCCWKRGHRQVNHEGTFNQATTDFVYNLLSKQGQRSFTLALLKLFGACLEKPANTDRIYNVEDSQAAFKEEMNFFLFVADNLAHFSYCENEDIVVILKSIETTVISLGNQLIDSVNIILDSGSSGSSQRQSAVVECEFRELLARQFPIRLLMHLHSFLTRSYSIDFNKYDQYELSNRAVSINHASAKQFEPGEALKVFERSCVEPFCVESILNDFNQFEEHITNMDMLNDKPHSTSSQTNRRNVKKKTGPAKVRLTRQLQKLSFDS